MPFPSPIRPRIWCILQKSMGELHAVRVDDLGFQPYNVYFNNLLDLLGRQQCPSKIIWTFCTIAAFCVDDLVVIVTLLLPDFLDVFSDYCNTFTARTDLSPLSPTRKFDTSLYGSLGPIPGCFSSLCTRVPPLAVFYHVHLFRVLLLTSWMTARLTPFLRHRLRSGPCFVFLAHVADFFSCTSLLSQFLASTRTRHPRSLASSRLTATFWSSSSPSRHFRAASCAISRVVCSSSSILW